MKVCSVSCWGESDIASIIIADRLNIDFGVIGHAGETEHTVSNENYHKEEITAVSKDPFKIIEESRVVIFMMAESSLNLTSFELALYDELTRKYPYKEWVLFLPVDGDESAMNRVLGELSERNLPNLMVFPAPTEAAFVKTVWETIPCCAETLIGRLNESDTNEVIAEKIVQFCITGTLSDIEEV